MRRFKRHLMLAVTFVCALLLMVGCVITGSSSRVTVDVETDRLLVLNINTQLIQVMKLVQTMNFH